ncbi:MAG: adenylate/guanylate cyclase domain-containing protein [Deltaproteobacteria bacterium]|nr:adenylate/guanylate cyclase domain-containing protein [Deltaproteobacteria bacterium]
MNVRRIRLISGLILLAYLTTHLLNHAVGLISLQAMETGRLWFLAFWRNPLATAALYASFLVHFTLALWSFYQRHHLRMPLWEALQLTLGLCIPLLLAVHFAGTRLANEWYGVEDTYSKIVLTLWKLSPIHGWRQSILIVIAWIHGCIGFHFWLRLRPWYPRYAQVFFASALLLPVLALLGFVGSGREIDHLIDRDPGWIERTQRASNALGPGQGQDLVMVRDGIVYGFWLCLGGVWIARIIRHSYQRRRRIRVTYPDRRDALVPRGFSVLEASRLARIPHASVCGGRGRCSTCRVRVLSPAPALPPPSPAEQRVLQRVGAPPNVRLACQLRPTADLSVIPLLPANATASDAQVQPSYLAGQERTIAILFADMRAFTGIAEQKLPYDLVFLLNSYFEAVGEAITGAGGFVDKFVGDGVMALFGVETGPEQGSRQALAAAQAMVREVAALSQSLTAELVEPLRIGVGIHTGPAIVGRMGYGSNVHLTAIGDTVNVASRLQDSTKEYGCQLVISEQVAIHAGLNTSRLSRHELTVRNRREPLTIFVINDLQPLSRESSDAAPKAGEP